MLSDWSIASPIAITHLDTRYLIVKTPAGNIRTPAGNLEHQLAILEHQLAITPAGNIRTPAGNIMAYYAVCRDDPKKMAATLKVHK